MSGRDVDAASIGRDAVRPLCTGAPALSVLDSIWTADVATLLGPPGTGGVVQTLQVSVPGMTCRHCVRTVSNRLRDVIGVETITADAIGALVVLVGTMADADVLVALAECGFPGRLQS